VNTLGTLPFVRGKMDAKGVKISEDVNYGAVAQALASGTKEDIIAVLSYVGQRGELEASMMGYAGEVAGMLGYPDSDVVVAACSALGLMGKEGAPFADSVAEQLNSKEVPVRIAAAGALAQFGPDGLEFADQLGSLLADTDEQVKTVAVEALGAVGAQSHSQAIIELLKDPSPLVVSSACQALGNLGTTLADAIDSIGKCLSDDNTRYAAASAFQFLDQSGAKFIDDLISKCLTDQDIGTRQVAAVAVGNLADAVLASKECIEKLTGLLKDADPAVRCAAALAIGNMESKGIQFADAVAELLYDDQEDRSWLYLQMGGGAGRAIASSRLPKVAALIALGQMECQDKAGDIAAKLSDDSWEVKLVAMDSLSQLGEAGRDHSAAIGGALDDDMMPVRARACDIIGVMKAEEQAPQLAEKLEDLAPTVRTAALVALAEFPDVASSYSAEVFSMLKDPISGVRAAAITCMGGMGEVGQSYASVIGTQLFEEDMDMRAAACEALGKLGDYGAAFAEEVASCLQDPAPPVRVAAAKALSMMGPEGKAFLDDLMALENDQYQEVKEAAQKATQALTA